MYRSSSGSKHTHTHYQISASPALNAASGPHEPARKSQLNSWQLLKVAEDGCWQRQTECARIVCDVCVSLSWSALTHSSFGSRQQRSRTQHSSSSSSSSVAPVDEPPGCRGSIRVPVMMLLNCPTLSPPPLTPVSSPIHLHRQPLPPSVLQTLAAALAVLSSHPLNSY